MPSYAFYKTVYGGSLIPESVFPEMVARGKDWLGKLERQFRVTPCCPNGRELALCAIAEAMAEDRRRDLTETSVGDVKVKFFHADEKSLYRKMYSNISCFLEIKRGVM